MMKFFYTPNTCSLGIHILLEEIGEPYELSKVDFATRQQHGEDYRAISPKSKVPALQLDDGTVITEWPAVAFYLASKFPAAKLMPKDLMKQVRALEVCDYVVATIHMQGFSRTARPENFTFDEAGHDQVKQRGREIMERGFEVMSTRLIGPYALGEFCFADAALYYVEQWALHRAGLSLPEACRKHYELMLGRPSVQRMLKRENIVLQAA